MALHVELTWLTDEEKKLGRTLTTNSPRDAADICLALDMEALRGITNDLVLTSIREITLSRQIGAVVSLSAVAQAPSDREVGMDKLKLSIYCVSKPKREMLFRVIGPVDIAHGIFDDVTRAIENVVITDE